MIRTSIYIGASVLIWFAEGFLFSRFLAFSVAQTALLGVFYCVLLGAAIVGTRAMLRAPSHTAVEISQWRALSVAPMATTIVGSFLSLPLVLLVLALSKL